MAMFECPNCKRVSYDKVLWRAKFAREQITSTTYEKCETCETREKFLGKEGAKNLIEYCMRPNCKKIKEEGNDEWVVCQTPVEVLGGMEGNEMVAEYCDGCAAILDGIAQANKFRNRIQDLQKGNFD